MFKKTFAALTLLVSVFLFPLTAQAQSLVWLPLALREPPCREEWRQAWLRNDPHIASFSPCEEKRINALCIYHPLPFNALDYDDGRGPLYARERLPGLYCWDEKVKRTRLIRLPQRPSGPVLTLPTRN